MAVYQPYLYHKSNTKHAGFRLMVLTGLAIAKAALTAIGIGSAGVAAVAVGYPHGLDVALQNVPAMSHAHSVLEGLWHSFPGRGAPGR